MHAVICPICEGSGKYEKKNCHGCSDSTGVSRGWIEIPDNNKSEKEYIPMPIYPNTSEPIAPVYP